MFKVLLLLVCALILQSPRVAEAQGGDTVFVSRGARARVLVAGETARRVGRIATVSTDSLALRLCDRCGATSLALHQVVELEVWRSDARIRRRNERMGMVAGFLLVAGHGVVGLQRCERESRGHSDGPPCALGYPLVFLVAGAGGLGGGLIGALLPARRWHPAIVDR